MYPYRHPDSFWQQACPARNTLIVDDTALLLKHHHDYNCDHGHVATQCCSCSVDERSYTGRAVKPTVKREQVPLSEFPPRVRAKLDFLRWFYDRRGPKDQGDD